MSAAAAITVFVRPQRGDLLLLLIERAQREIEDEAGRMGGHDDRHCTRRVGALKQPPVACACCRPGRHA